MESAATDRGSGAGAAQRADFWRRWRWPLMVGGPAIILAVAAWFALTSGRSGSTDDAYVQRAKAPVSAAINGRVVEIDVVENQHVKAGQVLFKLDPADYIAQVHRSDADLAAARLQVSSLADAVTEQRVNLASALQDSVIRRNREAARRRLSCSRWRGLAASRWTRLSTMPSWPPAQVASAA